MNQLKALYRARGIRCAGRQVYGLRDRGEWLNQLREHGAYRRAERLYQQLDFLQALRREARRDLLIESRKHSATALLRGIPFLGPIRVALLVAVVETPHRFRTKRQFWAYIGLALETHISGEYRIVGGQIERSGKALALRGLNVSHNHDLKNIFKGAATLASLQPGPLRELFMAKVAHGMRPALARLTLARKLAAITLSLWKKGEVYDAERLKSSAA
jgi:transposase